MLEGLELVEFGFLAPSFFEKYTPFWVLMRCSPARPCACPISKRFCFRSIHEHQVRRRAAMRHHLSSSTCGVSGFSGYFRSKSVKPILCRRGRFVDSRVYLALLSLHFLFDFWDDAVDDHVMQQGGHSNTSVVGYLFQACIVIR